MLNRRHQVQNNQQLKEGLRTNDLEGMVYPLLSIDTHRSKMGEDRDVCVVSLTVKDRNPAKDLMEFVEKGFNFVLDADVSSGENEQGEYFVFIELDRTPKLAEQIKEIEYGIKKLTNINEWKFKYYQDTSEHDLTEETLSNVIPSTPEKYDGLLTKIKTEGIKRFFSKTLMDNLTLDGDVITIHKPFNKQVKLRMVKEATTDAILEGMTDIITMDEDSISEIFWLTKVLGDYNINKVGDKFMFDNNGQAMLLQRIE
jgi:hypothetical protein